MNNLSFDELKTLAESVASDTLLEQVTGGLSNDCHDDIVIGPIVIIPTECDNI